MSNTTPDDTPGPLTLDQLIDHLCDLRETLGGAVPIAYALDGEGNHALLAGEAEYGCIVETPDYLDLASMARLHTIVDDDYTDDDATLAVVLWPAAGQMPLVVTTARPMEEAAK